jgi:hypothetical protein
MNSSQKHKIRVKLIHRGQPGTLCIPQFPGKQSHWGDCEFIFALEERNYDWLVVIDDVSRKSSAPPERLACADQHTLLVTTEPPTITHYGRAFTGQFAHVLTSQDEQSLPHPNRIHSHTGNLWFNGHDFDEIQKINFNKKTADISTVCSSKRQKHTIHNARYEFTQRLKQQLPLLEIFGHGVRSIEHKYEALDNYRFHLAIENHVATHHWTEKLADPFLSGAIPIYYGCPNVSDYFPDDSYLAIDINKPDEALNAIKELISDPDNHTRRLGALREAQRLILHDYNLMAMLANLISNQFKATQAISGRPLYGRKQMRARHPSDLLKHIVWSAKKTFRF